MDSVEVACGDARDRTWCASLAIDYARRAGLSSRRCVEIGIAVAELVSNAARHAGGGLLLLRTIDEPRRGVEVIIRDHGPGIADVAQALEDGWSRGRPLLPHERRNGLGSGLGAVLRLMDEVHFERPADGGTRVVARKFGDRGGR